MRDIDTNKIYTLEELQKLDEPELLGLLRKYWGYAENEPLMITGRLIERNTLFFIEDICHASTGEFLFHPFLHKGLTAFIGPFPRGINPRGFFDGGWVRAILELSSLEERIKQGNPIALKAKRSSIAVMTELPEDLIRVFPAEGAILVEKLVLDFYREKNREEIFADKEAVISQFEAEKKAQSDIITALKEQTTQLTEHSRHLSKQIIDEDLRYQATKNNIEAAVRQQQAMSAEFLRRQTSMEQQLETLHQFIEQKSKLLQQLDLVEPDWLGNGDSTASTTKQSGHDFYDVFDAEPTRAIAYIQAYMHKKGIYYRRKVLEDFFALISTHDLIILAGDSGAGKTNLVKSFADAVGGKAIIVPVKPNWTSAEDLLGYYNPLDKKYLPTPFLEAMLEAAKNPDTPYFICLDEMNLARVEYYFADFLSLLEERSQLPEISLYSSNEEAHLVSEARNFLALIDDAKTKLDRPNVTSFLDLLRDEAINAKLHELCGFREGDSLLKYHGQLRKLLSSYLSTPSKLKLPANVRIIGAINVDETTHYLSPKILDRAHILRFASPLLSDWDAIEDEVENFDIDLDVPVKLTPQALGQREVYPVFDREDPLVMTLIQLARDYMEPLGIEFGLRTVRQARNYQKALAMFGYDEPLVLNNIVLHKVLPKLMFDGEKLGGNGLLRKDILIKLRGFLAQQLGPAAIRTDTDSCIQELDRVIKAAEANDWAVNYWSR